MLTNVEWRQLQASLERQQRNGSGEKENIDEGGLMKFYQKHKPLLIGPGRLRGHPKVCKIIQ